MVISNCKSMLSNLPFVLISGLFALIPFFFLPITPDWIDFNKGTLLILLTIVAGIVWLINGVRTKSLKLVQTPLDLPLLGIFVFYILSLIFSSERLSSFGNLATYTLPAGILFYFTCVNLLDTPKKWKSALYAFFGGSSILALVALLQFTLKSLGSSLAFIPAATLQLLTSFPLVDSLYSQTVFLAVVLVMVIIVTSSSDSIFHYVFLCLISFGLLVSIYQLWQNPPVFLSYQTSWRVATGTIGMDFKHGLLGSGPLTFLSDFTRFKTIDYNATATWSLRFGTSISELLNTLTTGGLALLIMSLIAITTGFRYLRNYQSFYRVSLREGSIIHDGFLNALMAGLLLIIVLFILLPFSFILYFLLFACLALTISGIHAKGAPGISQKEIFNPQFPAYVSYLFVSLPIIFYFVIVFFLGRFYLAEVKLRQSAEAANRNDGRATYNLQLAAQQLNPWAPGYLMALSQTNLLIADNIAARKDITDTDKQTIQGLVQQAIGFARQATALSPNNPVVWENLANIYRNLLNFAQGSDQWAVAAYQQVISLDPLNPKVRLDLGGIFFAKQDYQNAALHFQNAVNLKPDYANARYNLAQAYLKLNMTEPARQELLAVQQVICTATPESADCKKVGEEVSVLPTPTPTPEEKAPVVSPTVSPKTSPTPKTTVTPTIKQTVNPTLNPTPTIEIPTVSPTVTPTL